MAREMILSVLLLSVVLPVSGIAAAAPACREKCVAEQRECLASEACTSSTPDEQKECRRVCEKTYSFCVAACE